MNNNIEQHGFSVVASLFAHSEVESLLAALGSLSTAGRRGVAKLTRSEKLLELVRQHMIGAPRPVRAIYFDKSANANWLVAWHQDLTLAVEERIDVPGFGPWSVKAGVPHVQAPVELLEQMLAVRIHLDDCDETNGALRVLPGTHRLGRVSSERLQQLRKEHEEVVCHASTGDVMLMRPLLLHASGKSKGRGH